MWPGSGCDWESGRAPARLNRIRGLTALKDACQMSARFGFECALHHVARTAKTTRRVRMVQNGHAASSLTKTHIDNSAFFARVILDLDLNDRAGHPGSDASPGLISPCSASATFFRACRSVRNGIRNG